MLIYSLRVTKLLYSIYILKEFKQFKYFENFITLFTDVYIKFYYGKNNQ